MALQYGGSIVDNIVFLERHGKWKATIQPYFQPQEWKPSLWELDSYYSLHIGSNCDDPHASDAWYKKLLSVDID